MRLRDLLRPGAQPSRELLATMVAQGFTLKQVRKAREHLGLVVTRSGTGTNTRTTWALPAEPAAGSGALELEATAPNADMRASSAPAGRLRQVKVSAHGDERIGKASEHCDDGLQPFERQRIAVRIDQFVANGIAPGEAAEVARLLVLARDRAGIRDGSCAECQCLQVDGRCTVALAGNTAGPRPARELWQCGFARRGGP